MKTNGPLLAQATALAVACIAIFFVNACVPGEVPTGIPTQVLIPSTATDIPTPITPTPTQPILPGPADVLVTPSPALTEATPVVDRALVRQVIADLAQSLGVDEDQIELVRLESATWNNIDLGCGDGQLPELDLAISGYRIVLEIDGQAYEYHTDTRAKIRLCPQAGVVGGTTSVLLEADPIAAELVVLAQRRLAQQLDLPERRIRLVDIVPVMWTESSLGCPLPDQTYVPINIQGYRIVVAAGDDEYIYHTDIERLIPCDPENEQLPDEEQPAR